MNIPPLLTRRVLSEHQLYTPNSCTPNLSIYSTSFYLTRAKTDKKVIIVLVFTNESVRSC